jgi:putative phosphoesterase
VRYLIVSDSHGNEDVLHEIIDNMAEIDAIIHLGDHIEDITKWKKDISVPVYAICGNCDSPSSGEMEMIIEDHGQRILLTHGHHHGVKDDLYRLFHHAKAMEVEAVLYGHTHMPLTECVEGIWIHNPGSVALPKGGSHRQYTVMTVDKNGFDFCTKVL